MNKEYFYKEDDGNYYPTPFYESELEDELEIARDQSSALISKALGRDLVFFEGLDIVDVEIDEDGDHWTANLIMREEERYSSHSSLVQEGFDNMDKMDRVADCDMIRLFLEDGKELFVIQQDFTDRVATLYTNCERKIEDEFNSMILN